MIFLKTKQFKKKMSQQQQEYKRSDDAFSGANIILKAAATGDLVKAGVVYDKQNTQQVKGYSNSTVIRRNTIDSLRSASEQIISSINGVPQYREPLSHERKTTFFTLNMTGRVCDVAGFLAHKFKVDDSNYSRIQAKIVWAYVLSRMSSDRQFAANKVSTADPSIGAIDLVIPTEFGTFYELSLERTKILEDDSQSSEVKKAKLNELVKKLEYQAELIAWKMSSITMHYAGYADIYIKFKIASLYGSNFDTAQIRDWINSDNNIYNVLKEMLADNYDALVKVFIENGADDQWKAYILHGGYRTVQLGQYVNEKYEAVDLSLSGKVDFLQFYKIAQNHGLISNLYVDFVPSLRGEKQILETVPVDVVNPMGVLERQYKQVTVKTVTYPKFQYAGSDFINTNNAFALGYAHKICFDEHLKGEKKASDGTSHRKTKVLSTEQAVEEFIKSIRAKMNEPEKQYTGTSNTVNPIYVNLVRMGIHNPTVFHALMMREKVYVASDTWNPKNASGLTVKPKTTNTVWLFPALPVFDMNVVTKDSAYRFICRCFAYSSSTRRVQSSTKKNVDNRTPQEKFKDLTDVFYPDGNVPADVNHSHQGMKSPQPSQAYSAFHAPTIQMPQMPQLPQMQIPQQVHHYPPMHQGI